MRRPTKRGDKADAEKTPPGGRALERVKQDRRARGLPAIVASGPLAVGNDQKQASTPRPRARTTKKKKS